MSERENYQRRRLIREGAHQQGNLSEREGVTERGCLERGFLRKGKLSERETDQRGGVVREWGLLERGTY